MTNCKYSYYDLHLMVLQSAKLSGLPTGADILAALPDTCADSFCSDLLVEGFSYKPLDLCAGWDTNDKDPDRIRKRLKSAKYIHREALGLSVMELAERISDGRLTVADGYIGHNRDVVMALRRTVLPESDGMFGLELRSNGLFHCYVKTGCREFPRHLTVQGCRLEIRNAEPINPNRRGSFVLQSQLPLDPAWRMEKAGQSRFQLSYSKDRDQLVLRAGSVIDSRDFFGHTVDI